MFKFDMKFDDKEFMKNFSSGSQKEILNRLDFLFRQLAIEVQQKAKDIVANGSGSKPNSLVTTRIKRRGYSLGKKNVPSSSGGPMMHTGHLIRALKVRKTAWETLDEKGWEVYYKLDSRLKLYLKRVEWDFKQVGMGARLVGSGKSYVTVTEKMQKLFDNIKHVRG